MSATSVEKISQSLPQPTLLEFIDAVTGSHNNVITAGGIGTILGEELKFNTENEAEGIYFVDVAGNETKATVIAYRTEGKLMFNVPAGLPAGEYSLQVRRAYGANASIRTGDLNEPLFLS